MVGVGLTVKAEDPFSLERKMTGYDCRQGANLPQRARECLSRRYVGVNRLVLVRWSFGATFIPRRMNEPLAQLGTSTA